MIHYYLKRNWFPTFLGGTKYLWDAYVGNVKYFEDIEFSFAMFKKVLRARRHMSLYSRHVLEIVLVWKGLEKRKDF